MSGLLPQRPAAHVVRFQDWLAALPIAAKLRFVSLCNIAAVLIMVVAIAIGGKIALDLRAERMALSQAALDAAQVARAVETIRLASYRIADKAQAPEPGALGDEFAIATARVAELDQLALTATPALAQQIRAVRRALADYERQIAAAMTMPHVVRAVELRAIDASGARLSAVVKRLDTSLADHGAAIDALSRDRILALFGAFLFVAGVAITLIVVSARTLARDISAGLSGLTEAARAVASGKSWREPRGSKDRTRSASWRG